MCATFIACTDILGDFSAGPESNPPDASVDAAVDAAVEARATIDAADARSEIDAGAEAADAPPPVTELYVDPVNGSDSADGDSAHPLHTITTALARVSASAHKVIHLLSGTYAPGSNQESFPLTVPDGTSMTAVADGGVTLSPVAASAQAMVFEGGASVEGVTLSGFGTGMTDATGATGAVNLTSITITGCATGILFNGVTSTLTNSTIVQSATVGLSLAGSASATLNQTTITGPGQTGINVIGDATLTMNGGAVTAIGPTSGSIQAVYGDGSAQLSFVGVNIHDNGGGMFVRGSSHTTFSNATVTNSYTSGFGNSELLGIADTATAVIKDSTFSSAQGPCVLLYTGGVDVSISGSMITGCETGISTEQAATLLVRSTTVMQNTFYGVSLSGGGADFGTAARPGGNTIQQNAQYGLYVNGTTAYTVAAAGNTWTPNTTAPGLSVVWSGSAADREGIGVANA